MIMMTVMMMTIKAMMVTMGIAGQNGKISAMMS